MSNKYVRNIFDAIEMFSLLLIHNSWGKDWGEDGFGWLPYEYIMRGLAEDFWSAFKKEWIDTGLFEV